MNTHTQILICSASISGSSMSGYIEPMQQSFKDAGLKVKVKLNTSDNLTGRIEIYANTTDSEMRSKIYSHFKGHCSHAVYN
jgi:hypothetical protein